MTKNDFIETINYSGGESKFYSLKKVSEKFSLLNKWFKTEVLPLPRKPVIIVIGFFVLILNKKFASQSPVSLKNCGRTLFPQPIFNPQLT